jgi:hypothetical protein
MKRASPNSNQSHQTRSHLTIRRLGTTLRRKDDEAFYLARRSRVKPARANDTPTSGAHPAARFSARYFSMKQVIQKTVVADRDMVLDVLTERSSDALGFRGDREASSRGLFATP